MRVAVQVGAAWVRVAAEGRLLAELPASGASVPAVPVVLAGLFEGPVDELLLMRPSGAARPAAATGLPAHRVRTVPAAVAALAQHTRSTGAAVEHAVVVDVGHGGTEITRVRAGRVLAVRRVAVGGSGLDAVTVRVLAAAGASAAPAEARRVREELSLLPEVRSGTPPVLLGADVLRAALAGPLSVVVEAVRAAVAVAGPTRAPPVLLIGGVARTPLLAELLDAAGVADVQVAGRPDVAAVTGALWLPVRGQEPAGPAGRADAPAGPSPAADRVPARRTPFRRRRPAGAPPAAAVWSGTWLPPVVPARVRPSRAVPGVLAAAATVVGLLAAGAAVPTAPPAPLPPSGDVVQYGYAVRLPAGWAHTGGLPERRRSLLTPLAAPDGSDLISVERTPLGYDADAEPRRARAELRAEFAAAVATGAPLSAFDDDARFAGRSVVAYREAGGDGVGAVDWYVVLDGDAQLSVGCRHTPAGAGAVGSACATVVGSAHRTA